MISRARWAVYRLAWVMALPPIRLLAGLDRALRVTVGWGPLPRSWQVTQRLGYGHPPVSGRPLWMHCASLGEAKGLWALAAKLPPDMAILLTASTSQGAEFLSRQCAESGLAPSRRAARIAPLDHPGVVRAFLAKGGIRGLCLYEAELWPHYLSECRRVGIPVTLAAGRITPAAYPRYLRNRAAAGDLLSGLAWFEAQSPVDAERFLALGHRPAAIGSDYKAAHFLSASAGAVPARRDAFAFVSLHLDELRILLPAIAALRERGGIVVFPRRMSQLPGFRAALEPLGFSTHSTNPEAAWLLVDSLGQVSRLLPRCHSAFVGGSLNGAGCHNLWEPLAAGAAILFGPHYQAQESLAAALLAAGLARSVSGPDELATLPPPSEGVPAGNARLLASLRGALDTALRGFGERIFATFYAERPAPDSIRIGRSGRPEDG